MYTPPPISNHALPTCPKCGKFISENHYERHLRRCGTSHEQAQAISKEQGETPAGGTDYGPPDEEPRGTNWTKVAAYFVIFLLVGSTVVFFLLYALSLL